MPQVTTPAPTLEVVTAARRAREQAEIGQLLAVLDFVHAHLVDDLDDAAVVAPFDDAPALAGEGAPLVSEYAVIELGVALGMTTGSAMAYVGRALELRHRLPRLYTRVIAGQLSFWRAGKIAEATMRLPLAGADFVDVALAPFAHALTWAQQERTLADALLRYDPDAAAEEAARKAETRHAHLDLRGGFGYLDAVLDLPDALDLSDAISTVARQLGDAGCDEPLDVRRAMALGEIARDQLALDLEAGASGTGRGVTIYAHVTQGEATAFVDNTRHPVLIDELATWCTTATKVIIKPVIDLNQTTSTDAYQVPDRIDEHITLRDRTCVFPYCDRPATACDDDHVTPWPRGSTTTDNLAPLCRRHHRAKTHAGFTYAVLHPGTYHWTTPTGIHLTRDPTGTHT